MGCCVTANKDSFYKPSKFNGKLIFNSILSLYNSLMGFVQIVGEHFDDYENESMGLLSNEIEYQARQKKTIN